MDSTQVARTTYRDIEAASSKGLEWIEDDLFVRDTAALKAQLVSLQALAGRPRRAGVPGHSDCARRHAAARRGGRPTWISAAANAAPGPGRPGGPEMVPRVPSLGELLEEITAARARSRAPSEVDETPWAGPPRRGIGFPLAGCLIRILGIAFLLFLAFVAFLFLLFGGLIGR